MEDNGIIQFSKRDLNMGKVVDPAWYRVRVDEYGPEPSKNVESPSTNHWIYGTILFNADTGDKKFEEVTLRWNFNSKALGFAKGFFIALGEKEDEMTENSRFSFKMAEGKELDVFIENSLWEGRMQNKVNHKYRTPRS